MPSRTILLAAVVLASAAIAHPGLADDPPGSSASAPRPPVPGPQAIPLPDRGPAALSMSSLAVPPALFEVTPDPQAALDQQIDAILGAVPPDSGFGFAAPSGGARTAASSSNCWSDGTGCGPGGQAGFVANCDAAGGGLSSEDDPEHGPYIKCTLPPAS